MRCFNLSDEEDGSAIFDFEGTSPEVYVLL